MNGTQVARATLVVRPMRFTDHLSSMQEFLAQLGYSTRISRDNSWVTMVGASGQVALHDAALSGSDTPSGKTDLIFEVDSAEELAAQFAEAGFSHVEIYDEAWGRALRVGDGDTQLYFDERPNDFYGYQLDDARPKHGIVSMPLLLNPPSDSLVRLFSAAGLTRFEEDDDPGANTWIVAGGGIVSQRASGNGESLGAVMLAFRTDEPLTQLARRLVAAGYADATHSDESGSELTVTDPDGQSVIVQSTRERRLA